MVKLKASWFSPIFFDVQIFNISDLLFLFCPEEIFFVDICNRMLDFFHL